MIVVFLLNLLSLFLIFRVCIKDAKEAFERLGQDSNPTRSANSCDVKVHISWHFAEQVHIPYSSQQVVCTVCAFFAYKFFKGK